MIHHFSESLKKEKNFAAMADEFYSGRLNAINIVRYNNDTEDDMKMQRQDIDVQLTINNKIYRISEKFREKDFGDMYLEVYSKYPHRKGWMDTGSPNAVLYFTPQKVYWFTHSSLHRFYHQLLFPCLKQEWFEQLYKSSYHILTKTAILNDSETILHLIKADNKEGAEWETMGVSVGYDVLKNNGVVFEAFEK